MAADGMAVSLRLPSTSSPPANMNANIKIQRKWRVLTIDDNPSIHEDYRKVLLSDRNREKLAETEALLFGEPAPLCNSDRFQYEIDSASQGQDGLELVRKATESGQPYSAALIDMRMPPGWDGVETAKRIWEVVPDLPIVLCTAYSDYSWEEVADHLPRTHQLLILKKPFEPFELRQIVAAQVTRWDLNRRAAQTQGRSDAVIRPDARVSQSLIDMAYPTITRLISSRVSDAGEHI